MLCIESFSYRSILVEQNDTFHHECRVCITLWNRVCIRKDRKCRTDPLLNTWKSRRHLSKTCKWVKRYSDVKDIDDLPGSVQKMTKKEDRMILWMFDKNPRLLLRGGQTEKGSKYIMWYYKKTFTGLWNFEAQWRNRYCALKNTLKKDSLGRKKIWIAIGDNVIFSDESFLGTFFYSSYLIYPHH